MASTTATADRFFSAARVAPLLRDAGGGGDPLITASAPRPFRVRAPAPAPATALDEGGGGEGGTYDDPESDAEFASALAEIDMSTTPMTEAEAYEMLGMRGYAPDGMGGGEAVDDFPITSRGEYRSMADLARASFGAEPNPAEAILRMIPGVLSAAGGALTPGGGKQQTVSDRDRAAQAAEVAKLQAEMERARLAEEARAARTRQYLWIGGGVTGGALLLLLIRYLTRSR